MIVSIKNIIQKIKLQIEMKFDQESVNNFYTQQQSKSITKFGKFLWTNLQKAILKDSYDKYQHDWQKIANQLPGRTKQACKTMANTLKILKKPQMRKAYTHQQDEKLLYLFEKYDGNWKYISNQFIDRSALSCRERFNKLKSIHLNKFWSTKQSNQLIEIYQERRGNWKEIHQHFQKFTLFECFFKYHTYSQPQKSFKKQLSGLKKFWESRKIKLKPNQKQNTPWTFIEDDLLLKAAQQFQYQWEKISKVLSSARTIHSYKSRYNFLKKVEANKNQKNWSEEEDRKLLLYLELNPLRFCAICKNLDKCTRQDVYLRCRQHMANNDILKEKIYKLQQQLQNKQRNELNGTEQKIEEIFFDRFKIVIQEQLKMMIQCTNSFN